MTVAGLGLVEDDYSKSVEDQGVDLSGQHDRAVQPGAYEVGT